jgi:ArsR family transcriptional regulator, arsenate/arsenite/antimonite-responsive transcriptional repressor
MSITVNTMRVNASALGSRLERLTGRSAACCLSDYRALGEQVRRAPAYLRRLERARALADPHRLVAVELLRRKNELCACEIQAALGVTHATVSHHMSILVEAGVVAARRKGKWLYYSVRPENRPRRPETVGG